MPCRQTVTTIYFDGQFWVALVERIDGDAVEMARHVFGPEPGNAELLEWAEKGFAGLSFHPVLGRVLQEPPANPKRRKRAAARENRKDPSSRSRDALKMAAEFEAKQKGARGTKARRAEAARRYADRVARKKARRLGKA